MGVDESEELLEALGAGVEADKSLKDSQDAPAVFHHVLENVAQSGLALGFAVPLGEDSGRHFDIPAQLFGGVAAQKEAVEEGGLTLRILEVAKAIVGGCVVELHGCRKGAVYRKERWCQVVLRYPAPVRTWGES